MADLNPYNPDGVNRIVRTVDLDNPVRGDTDEVRHVAEAMLVAFEHRNDGGSLASHDWRDTCDLDLDNSDIWIPDVACLGGVVCYVGDDLDSIVALQTQAGRVVAIVVQDAACD